MVEERTWQERVLQVFQDLGSEWQRFLSDHGFHFDWPAIEAAASAEAFNQPCKVDLGLPAFCDMPSEVNWIFPGRPAQSVLYHLLASADAAPYLPAPTQEQIETVENAVYAAQSFDMESLYKYANTILSDGEKDAEGKPILRVVVFACEYRASSGTPHGLHADMCYSRTGVARVGTVRLPYKEGLRSYPFTDAEDPFQIPVLPARYAAFLAVSCPESERFLGPYRQTQEEDRRFWIPVHKLFPGTGCLRGINIGLNFEACHVNEKLRRFHAFLTDIKVDTGLQNQNLDINTSPFLFTEGIADLNQPAGASSCEVMPNAHSRLVKRVSHGGQWLSYRVPPNGLNRFIDNISSSLALTPTLNPPQGGECHPTPEVLSARHQLLEGGMILNLNTRRDVEERVKQGDYYALHFKDFTGDGWVAADIRFDAQPDASGGDSQPFPLDTLPPLAAYSLVSPPDFLPRVGQRAATRLFERQVPVALREKFWDQLPLALADQRQAPNFTLNQLPVAVPCASPRFDMEDTTVTAVVTMPCCPPPASSGPASHGSENCSEEVNERRSYLPDAAAGLFAPGWDVGIDMKEIKTEEKEEPEQRLHLAMYSLGSPFVTDSKLCAAFSAFWPAAAPDTTRTFPPIFERPVIVPLTDHEIGSGGGTPWDGIKGPHLCRKQTRVDYPSFANSDYVVSALKRRFYLKHLAEITTEEYISRLLAMLRVYKALGVAVEKISSANKLAQAKSVWALLSFRKIEPTHLLPANGSASEPLFQEAQKSQGSADPFFTPMDSVYYFEMYQWASVEPSPFDPRRSRVTIKRDAENRRIRRQLFVGKRDILMWNVAVGKWEIAPRVEGL